jgi:hypothetical protein
MPLIPPFGITASYQKDQYGSGPYNTGGSQVFSHLQSPPSTGTNAETVSSNNAHAVGFTGHGAANEVQSIALTGTPATGGTFFLIWNDAVTAPIAYNAAAAAVQTALNALPGMTYGTNAVDSVTITGAPTGGTFTLTTGGQTTAPLAITATNFQVQSALASLSSVGLNNVVVTGPPGGPWQVTFQGAKGAQPITMTAANTFTGGTTPAAVVASVVTGVGPTANTVVTGGPGPATPWVVTFGGRLAGLNVNPIMADGSALTPAGAIAGVTTTTSGEGAFTPGSPPGFSGSTNPAVLNATRQFDSMRNFYDSGSGNHW